MATETPKHKLPLKEIAVRVRADIKAAIKDGRLPAFKVSVVTDYYSMGQSLDVKVKAVPAGYLVPNLANVIWAKENPNTYPGHAPSNARNRESDEARAHLAIIDGIVSEYHRNDSDMMTDYYSVNFAKRVDFHWELESNQRKELLASLEEDAKCPVVRVSPKAA